MANYSHRIRLNVPCCKCGTNLHGMDPAGQCVECGMDIAKSLAVVACRGLPASDLHHIRQGLNAQIWATLIAVGACILGPLVFGVTVPFEIFALVIAVGLSSLSAVRILMVRSNGMSDGSRPISAFMMVLGSASLVLPATALRLATIKSVPSWIPAAILIACAAWFLGECAKLHLIEDAAVLSHGRELAVRARNLRRGIAIVALLLSLALLPLAMRVIDFSQVLSVQFVLVGAVGVLVLSLMTVLLFGRMSTQIKHHELLTETVRRQAGQVDDGDIPGDSDWAMPNMGR